MFGRRLRATPLLSTTGCLREDRVRSHVGNSQAWVHANLARYPRETPEREETPEYRFKIIK